MQVKLIAVINGRFDEAAEVLRDFAKPHEGVEWGSPWMGAVTMLPHCKSMVTVLTRGLNVVVEVPDQKSLNAIAGFFWVEPRRFPGSEA